ncbi:hypothetical protein QE152_g38039 [Popillia japonica]|uniref:Uncharacterized protein n=1 Tax=Popillia japonica TaxID=7064 RepID=A0AAW1I925_POPJA
MRHEPLLQLYPQIKPLLLLAIHICQATMPMNPLPPRLQLDEIAAIEASRKLKSVKKRVLSDEKKKAKKAKKKTNKKSASDDEDAENDCFYLCCLESYASIKSNEKWVQCLNCKGWSHEDCTGGSSGKYFSKDARIEVQDQGLDGRGHHLQKAFKRINTSCSTAIDGRGHHLQKAFKRINTSCSTAIGRRRHQNEGDTICRRRSNASTPAAQLPSEDGATKMPFFLETPTTSQRETDTPPAPLVARLLNIYHQGVACWGCQGQHLIFRCQGQHLIPRCQGQHLISRYQDQHHISTADRGQTSGGPPDADPGDATPKPEPPRPFGSTLSEDPLVYLARLEAHSKGPACLPGPARSPQQGTHHSHPRGRGRPSTGPACLPGPARSPQQGTHHSHPRGRGRPSTPIPHRRSYHVVSTTRGQPGRGRPSTPIPHRRSYHVVSTTRGQHHEQGRVLPAVQGGIPQLQAQTEPS